MKKVEEEKINTRMARNLYNKVDAKDWQVKPKQSEVEDTVFLDVSRLVLFDKKLLGSALEESNEEIDLDEMFSEI